MITRIANERISRWNRQYYASHREIGEGWAVGHFATAGGFVVYESFGPSKYSPNLKGWTRASMIRNGVRMVVDIDGYITSKRSASQRLRRIFKAMDR